METKSQLLLVEIQALWNETRSKHRDGMVAVGRLIHQFLLERAKEEQSGTQARKSREYAIIEITELLGIDRIKVYNLLTAVSVVDLLGQGGLGNVSYSFLVACAKLIQRKQCDTRENHNYRNQENWNQWRADRETWEVRGIEIDGRTPQEFFDWARDEGLSAEQVRTTLSYIGRTAWGDGRPLTAKEIVTARIRPSRASKEESDDCLFPGSEYDDNERKFLRAMDDYKRNNRRPHPNWTEVLDVIRSLGWQPPQDS